MNSSSKTSEWAVIGDMVNSRRVPDRAAAFKAISEALEEINGEYRNSIKAPLLLTQGIDELSGVLSGAEDALSMVHRFNLKIWPLKFRFGIGKGRVESLQKEATAGRMDGPGFHLAAAAIARAHKCGLPLALGVEGTRPAELEAVEVLGELCLHQRDNWRHSSVDTLRAWLAAEAEGETQSDLAQRIGKTQQAVSSALRRSGIHALERAEAASKALMAQI